MSMSVLSVQFFKFVYTIYRNDMVIFLTPSTSKNQEARGMFALIESIFKVIPNFRENEILMCNEKFCNEMK